VDVAVGMGEGDAENDDGSEADDEESESAHGTNLARNVRDRRHGSSLSCDWGPDQMDMKSTRRAVCEGMEDREIRDLRWGGAGGGVRKREMCSGVDRGQAIGDRDRKIGTA
jgi:hypothetical protein